MNLWQYVVRIHQTSDWVALVQFWGVGAACIVFLCLQLLLLRSRKLALRALDTARRLLEDMRALENQLDESERRVERRLDSRTSELDARMTKKLDQKGDLIQERIDQRTSALNDSIRKVEARAGRANDEVERFREQLAQVEGRIPGLFDKLDEFRETLAKTFEAELGSVLNSFDNSMTAVLQQMKSELQMGISRIESIEGMVRSRETAQRTLLGAPEQPEPEPEQQKGGEFEEWEEEAKELAASDESRDSAAEAAEAPAPPEGGEDENGYPSEMGEPGEALQEGLFDDAFGAADEESPDEESEEG